MRIREKGVMATSSAGQWKPTSARKPWRRPCQRVSAACDPNAEKKGQSAPLPSSQKSRALFCCLLRPRFHRRCTSFRLEDVEEESLAKSETEFPAPPTRN